MNYIVNEDQYQALSEAQAQLQLLTELLCQITTKQIHLDAQSLNCAINAISEKLKNTLISVSST